MNPLRFRFVAPLALPMLLSGAAAFAQVWPVGNFAASWPTTGLSGGRALLAADLDADGRADLVAHGLVADNRGGVWVYLSHGRALELRSTFDPGQPEEMLGSALAAGDFASHPGIVRPHFVLGHPGWPDGTNEGQVWIYTLDAGGAPVLVGSFRQGEDGIPGASEAGDYFGRALAVGDFDGDAVEDLAVGAPGEDLPGGVDAGAVHVIYGGTTGLDATSSEIWTQGTTGVPDASEPDDFFGFALAAGDFDGDGFDDLAIGAPGEALGTVEFAGAVTVLRGTADGLATQGAQWLTEGDGIVPGTAEFGDYFGHSLAAGRLGHDDPQQVPADEEDDLVIGIPYETVGTEAQAGAAVALLGRSSGFDAAGVRRFTQNGLPGGVAETVDFFAYTLAVGDADRDGWDELVLGAVGETHLGLADHGVVYVVPGSPTGLALAASQLVVPTAAYELFPLQPVVNFGAALALPDLDGNGHADLAVGAPNWDNGAAVDAGAVQLLFGALFADGFDTGDAAAWSTVAP